jgi:hypothetical protein
MSAATKAVLLAVVVAAALLATRAWQRGDGAARTQHAAAGPGIESAVIQSPRAAASSSPAASTSAAVEPEPTALRPGEAELRNRAVDESYARVGDVLVEHLVARGLAHADAEPVIRRFLEDNQRCLFDALRIEADARSVAYDSVLDAMEAELYDTDGPLLGALLDMSAVQARAMPCGLAAAQQAGIEASALGETTRAALARRAGR